MNKVTQLSNQVKSVNLDIDGMTCAACAARVERVLTKNEHVLDASVSFPLKSAIVDVIGDESFDFDEIIKSVNKIGYKAKEAAEDNTKKNVKFKIFTPMVSLLLTVSLRYFFEAGLDLISYLIGFFVILVLGRNFHISAFKKIKNLDFNMDTLISLGSLSSLLISLIPAELVSSVSPTSGENKMFLDTGAFIVSFLLIGKAVEDRVIEESVKTSESIKSRMPKTLIVNRDQDIIEIPTKDVQEKDRFNVKVGEIIPVDGEIIEGETTVDESLLTGESIPLMKEKGDRVVGGSVNLQGNIEIEVKESYQKSTYNIIEDLIRNAQGTKPDIQKSLDTITQYFVPFVLFTSFSTFAVKYLIQDVALIDALKNAIAVLVIACPCALGLATPIVLFKTATASKLKGFLFKNFDILQKFGDINTMVFDKTGTLSSGIFKIREIQMPNETITRSNVLQLIASLENYSQHPIAKSIVYQAELEDLPLLPASNVKEKPGIGIEGIVKEQLIKIEKNKESNDSSLKVTINDKDYFLNLDEESSVSNNFLKELKKEKNIIILSGDKKVNVEKFAEEQNIKEFYSDKSPEEKLNFVKDIQKDGRVIFVGDGVNDSPSIKQADVGVTTSSSSQIAQVSGDILIHKGGLETLSEIFNLSKKSKYRIYQNLFLAFIYNTLMIPIAVVGLITPNLAALAMALSSISVVINSSRKL
ncbi:MAG: cation-translocating P-type ATPase [Actinomycetota bacterium]|jgi:Cu+-exporting ATPase|nr:cadmium-translocating P-type ATPase [Candidatus Actinomarina sp.]MDA2946501.1 cation-translocating P-type ATPase [Actinomycetota bacterium]MDA3036895.1 cation-translocating P-type ATPase [Actinomycetota bacterium]